MRWVTPYRYDIDKPAGLIMLLLFGFASDISCQTKKNIHK